MVEVVEKWLCNGWKWKHWKNGWKREGWGSNFFSPSPYLPSEGTMGGWIPVSDGKGRAQHFQSLWAKAPLSGLVPKVSRPVDGVAELVCTNTSFRLHVKMILLLTIEMDKIQDTQKLKGKIISNAKNEKGPKVYNISSKEATNLENWENRATLKRLIRRGKTYKEIQTRKRSIREITFKWL